MTATYGADAGKHVFAVPFAFLMYGFHLSVMEEHHILAGLEALYVIGGKSLRKGGAL